MSDTVIWKQTRWQFGKVDVQSQLNGLKLNSDRAIHDLRNMEYAMSKNTFATFDESYENDILNRTYKKYIC